jgi:hypothetical protein
MSEICKCGDGIINSGLPVSCTFGRTQKLIFVQRIANDGTENKVDCSLLSNVDYVTERLNDPDKSKRWYPTDLIYSVVEERADPVTETIDNVNRIVEKGQRTFTGLFTDKGSSNPTYLKFLNSLGCLSVGYYGVDAAGNLIGLETQSGILYPFPIQDNTLFTKYIAPTAPAIGKNQITFTLSNLMKDQDISYIPASSFSPNLTKANGLIDVVISQVIAGELDVELKAQFTYGNACSKLNFNGATTVTDWTVYNKTTSTAVTLASVTQDEINRLYTLEFDSAQPVGNVLEISTNKDGFESNIVTATIQ